VPESLKRLAVVIGALLSAPAANAGEWADPTRPDNHEVQGVAAAAPSFRLSAIFKSGDRRVAVLNGHLLRVGDRLGSAELVRIGEDRITLKIDGHSIVRTLDNGRQSK
jgi:hypothetical protein